MPGVLVVANDEVEIDVDYLKHNIRREYGNDWFVSSCDKQIDHVKDKYQTAIVVGECPFVTGDMFDRVIYADEDGDVMAEIIDILETEEETDTPEDQAVEGLET